MRLLAVAAVIHILTLARSHLGHFGVPRSFYDNLSILLPVCLLAYYFLSPRLISYERKIEIGAVRLGKKWLPPLIDGLVIVLAVGFIYKATKNIYFYPVSCTSADMLPIIRSAGESLLSLKSPFSQTYCSYTGGFPYLPMMLISYLPAIALRIDLRIVSIFFWLCLTLLGYFHYQKNGYRLTGFFISLFLLTSGLIPWLLITVHVFPYLFVLAVVLLACWKDNDKALSFFLAFALASRKFFWLYLPFFAIYLYKSRKITPANLKLFGLGGLLGFSPYILFPADFIKSNLYHVSNATRQSWPGLFLEHSLGWTYRLMNHRTLSTMILIALYGLIIILAVRFLNKRNLWVFMFLATLTFFYFQVFSRPQEYYFLPLVIILMFAPLERQEIRSEIKKPLFPGVLVMLCLAFIFFNFPRLSGTALHVDSLNGGRSLALKGEFLSEGHLELSMGGNFRRPRTMMFLIRRMNAPGNEPVRVTITINEKSFLNEVFRTRRIEIPIDEVSQKKYFYRGGNSVKIHLDEREAFRLSVRRGRPIDKN